MRSPGPRTVLAFAALGWLPRIGCHEVSEYDSYGAYGVGTLHLPDLVMEGEVIEGFEGGRSVCSLGADQFLVACTTGQVYLASTQERAVIEVYMLGQPFASGYGDMIYAQDNRAYVIGGFGQVIEFSPSVGAVLEVFTAGPQPVSLCMSVRPDRFFVGDGLDDKVREVAIPENLVVRERLLMCPPTAMAGSFDADSLLVVVSAVENGFRYVIDTGFWFYPWDYGTFEPAADVAAMKDTLLYCVANPGYNLSSGSADVVAVIHLPDTLLSRRIDLEGHPTRVVSDPDAGTFYVSSPLGNGYSRIYAIDGYSAAIIESVDIPGYVWDIELHADGDYLLFLTSSD